MKWKVGEMCQAKFMDTWHQNCRVSRTSGKHTCVNTPNVMDDQCGCLLLPMGTPTNHEPEEMEEKDDDEAQR